MPIAKFKHEEEGRDGKPVFIVQTPVPHWAGERCGVTFVNGEGRTEYEERARELSEVYGYLVILPSGYEPWVEHVEENVGRHARDILPEDAPRTPRERPMRRKKAVAA